MLLLFSGCGEKRDTLHIYSWAEFFEPGLIRKFEQENNCRVVIDTFDTNEAMYARLRAGASGYDLVMPSDYFVDIMDKQNLLEPIDHNLIPNLKYLDVSDPTISTGTNLQIAIPFMQSYTAMGYLKHRITNPEPSWAMFSRENLRGRMTLFNDMRETLGAALKFLGYSANTTDPEEINAAADQVIAWKKNLAKFETEQFKNGLATAEFLLSQAYAGDVAKLQREDPNISLLIPREGVVISMDFFCIPRGAQRLDLAHRFIDFIYRPENTARNVEYLTYRVPHGAAQELLSKTLREHPAVKIPEEVLEKSERLKDLGEATQLYIAAWERVKAAP